mgnify:FL=1
MYSFAKTQQEHEKIYEGTVQAYHKIYERLGLGDFTYRTYADGGIFTDKFSDEFQTLSDVGEDTIYVDETRKIAINKEIMTEEKRGVEVGNTFHLESKYTDALDVYFTDDQGQKQSIISGCYGIGISRLMGVIAEQFADEKGLVWPENITPFKVYLVQIGDTVKQARAVYKALQEKGITVLWDDRDVRPGEKFADGELIGLPHRVVVSEKLDGQVEYSSRTGNEKEVLTVEALLAKLGN